MKLHLNTEYPEATTDGLGIRYSIYAQGCRGGLWGDCIRNCPGCQNPETWSFDDEAPGSYWLETDELVKKIEQSQLSWGKLTLCGGDPIWQAEACIELIDKLKTQKPDYSIWAYTGLLYEFIVNHADKQNYWRDYLDRLDVLIDGPFVLEQRDITLPWRGSPNQRVINVQKSLQTGKVILAKYD